MSHSLPQEILDLIIDDLHDEPAALKACCLVSSAWVHRTRNHLFARIEFNTFTCPIGRWRETFPDPTNSPAHNARALSIRFPKCITASNVDLFRTFRNVICLNVESDSMIRHEATLVPLHGFSTVLRSLRLVATFFADSEVFDLVCSLPLLEDLALVFRTPWRPQEWTRPRTSPRLTGSLELYVEGGFQSITDHLLRFPNGLHFRRLAVWLVTSQNIKPVEDLMSRCSDTLESLSITSLLPDPSPSINLSKAVRLRDVEFLCEEHCVQWIATALLSAGSKNIHQVSIGFSDEAFLQLSCRERSDLDPSLVHLWTSHPFRLKVMHEHVNVSAGAVIARLLPRITEKGVVDVVEHPCVPSNFLTLGTTFC